MKTKLQLARTAVLLLFAVLSTTGAWAEDKAKGIVVWLSDGNKTEVLFTDMPEFTYADGNVTMKSMSTELSWPIAQLVKFTFEDVVITGIRNIADLDILSDNCEAYDLSGCLIRKGVKSLSELPAGTYIVKDGNTTIKVVRK